VRRAGLVGGVVSALALTGAAAPALATSNGSGSDTVRDAASTTSAVSSLTATSSAQQAAAAFEQGAIDAKLAAEKQQAATAAKKSAAAAKKAAQEKAAKAAAALKAAREKAAAEAAAEPTSSASSSSTASSSSASSASTASTTVAPASSSKVDQLIAFLKSQLGKPYVYGATGPDSYDCSGLTQVAFSSVGVSIPRTSEEQSTVGTPVGISDLQPGDLIFWGGEGSAYHVGVFIGDGQYLDAANSSTPVAIHQLADYMPDWAVRVL
jgi:cell wall-associated NlpC family hydrolase